jgi:hypothetical protein
MERAFPRSDVGKLRRRRYSGWQMLHREDTRGAAQKFSAGPISA